MNEQPILRSARIDDVAGAGAVIEAEDLAVVGEVVLGTEFLAMAWARPSVDLDRDAWVIEDTDGTIIGIADVTDDEPGVTSSFAVVHPDRTNSRLRAMLWDAAERRAAERQAGHPNPRVRHATNADDEAENAELAARGMRIVRHFWHMQIDLDGTETAADPPPGVTIDHPTHDDLPGMHRIVMTSFRDHFGHDDLPWEAWRDEVTSSPTFHLGTCLVARLDGDAVGALIAEDTGDRGWIGTVGVLENARGRGIGEALLRRSFADFAARGTPRVLLNVDAANSTGATALYERVGMRVLRPWLLWERELHS